MQQSVRLQHVAVRATERPLPVPRAHVRPALRALLPVLSRPLPPCGRHVRLRAGLPRQVLPGAVPCRPLRPGLPSPVSMSPRPRGWGARKGGQPKGTGISRLRAPSSLRPLLQMRPMQGPAAMHGGRRPLPDLRARLEWHQVRPAVRHWLLWRGLWPPLPAMSRRARLQSRHRQVHALQCGLDWRPVSSPCRNRPQPRLPRCPPQRALWALGSFTSISAHTSSPPSEVRDQVQQWHLWRGLRIRVRRLRQRPLRLSVGALPVQTWRPRAPVSARGPKGCWGYVPDTGLSPDPRCCYVGG